MEIGWNMAGVPEWKDDIPNSKTGRIIPLINGPQSVVFAPGGEFWILRRTLDGWRLVSESPNGSLEDAHNNIRAMSPGTYKILATHMSYKSEIELLPLTED